MEKLETEISEWRAFVAQGPGVAGRDVEELEAHLRDQIGDLVNAGLTDDEAFLIAVRRMGTIDELSREFAREHSGSLWRQLLVSDQTTDQHYDQWWVEALVFAAIAAVAVQVARLLADFPSQESSWLVRNAGLFVLPVLSGYFVRRRRLPRGQALLTVIPFAALAIVINLYPYTENSATEILVAAHLPVALWFVVAYSYMNGMAGSHERRMDYVRFSGEWFIYYVLIALGGGVLLALTALILEPTGVEVDKVFEWVLPSGAAGAVLIAAWLVESKQRVVENMAPVLTMLFTPLFAAMLVVAVVAYLATGLGAVFDRELLGIFDALLVVVLGLVLYGISARDPSASPGWMDRIQFVAVVSALVLDAIVLAVMVSRIGELGFTPNRTAALGLNIVLLVSLAGTALLAGRFLTGHGTFHDLERWQTNYLPVFAVWAVLVVVALPALFGFA